jgi:AcrR family transcriptional regulator
MIYYHFDSKDKLYLEVVTSFYKHVGRQAEETVLATETLEEALSALFALHQSMFSDHEHIRPMILRELADPRPEVLDAVTSIFSSAGIPQKIASLLSDGMNRGIYRRVDIQQALVAFASMSIYYHIMAPFVNRVVGIDDPRKFTAERSNAIVDIFLNGLKAR